MAPSARALTVVQFADAAGLDRGWPQHPLRPVGAEADFLGSLHATQDTSHTAVRTRSRPSASETSRATIGRSLRRKTAMMSASEIEMLAQAHHAFLNRA
jgi:hypothetical protein